MTVAGRRLCFSNDPFCTGARPCTPCFEQLKTVLAHALFRSGVSDLQAEALVNAFALSITESVYTMLRQMDVTATAEEVAPTEPPEPPAPSATPSSLDVKALMEQAMTTLGPGELQSFCQEILNGTLEGWDLLSETEREGMRTLAQKLVSSAETRKELAAQTKKVKAKIKARKASGAASPPKDVEEVVAAPSESTAVGSDAPAEGRVDTALITGDTKNGTAPVAVSEGN